MPAATFLIGVAEHPGRAPGYEDDIPGPGGEPVSVAIPRPFATGEYEVTRGQFAAFVQATGHRVGTGCYAREQRRELRPELSWTAPGFDQDDNHPVTCVSWRDAVDAQWLSARVGASYRLLTEAEWEYAARGGSDTPYAFGDKDSEICKYGNGADLMSREADPNWIVAPCRDQFRFTAPIGSFLPNAYGLYDMHGNLWEWVEDCASDSLRHFSAIALARLDERQSCSADAPRMLRGGSWSDPPQRLRSAARIAGPPDDRDYIVGFRVAPHARLRALAPKIRPASHAQVGSSHPMEQGLCLLDKLPSARGRKRLAIEFRLCGALEMHGRSARRNRVASGGLDWLRRTGSYRIHRFRFGRRGRLGANVGVYRARVA